MDSNHEWESQNLQCYHYTTRYRRLPKLNLGNDSARHAEVRCDPQFPNENPIRPPAYAEVLLGRRPTAGHRKRQLFEFDRQIDPDLADAVRNRNRHRSEVEDSLDSDGHEAVGHGLGRPARNGPTDASDPLAPAATTSTIRITIRFFIE